MLTLMLAVSLSAPVRSPGDYAMLQGTVAIFTRTSNAVGILVDSDSDGTPEDLFWFYSDKVPTIHTVIERAAVEFRGDELVVIGVDPPGAYVFSVGRPKVAIRLGTDSPKASSSYAGYGISHKMGPQLAAIHRHSTSGRLSALEDNCMDYDGCVLYPDPDGGSGFPGGGPCDAGGHGAPACSVTRSDGNACSTVCNTGYYACCVRNSLQPPYCYCVHE